MTVTNVQFRAGKLVVTFDVEPAREYDIVNYLRAADIPAGLTYTQVAAISTLANMVVVLIRTLIERQVLDESFVDSHGLDWDLDDSIHAIEQMGGQYHSPDFDNV